MCVRKCPAFLLILLSLWLITNRQSRLFSFCPGAKVYIGHFFVGGWQCGKAANWTVISLLHDTPLEEGPCFFRPINYIALSASKINPPQLSDAAGWPMPLWSCQWYNGLFLTDYCPIGPEDFSPRLIQCPICYPRLVKCPVWGPRLRGGSNEC